MFDRRLIQNFDWVLVLLLILIAGVSLTNLYSATYPIWDARAPDIPEADILVPDRFCLLFYNGSV
jgi:rod shape determining protein RodA